MCVRDDKGGVSVTGTIYLGGMKHIVNTAVYLAIAALVAWCFYDGQADTHRGLLGFARGLVAGQIAIMTIEYYRNIYRKRK